MEDLGEQKNNNVLGTVTFLDEFENLGREPDSLPNKITVWEKECNHYMERSLEKKEDYLISLTVK